MNYTTCFKAYVFVYPGTDYQGGACLGSVIYSYSNKAMWDSCNVQVYIYIHLYIKYKNIKYKI
jgi:hypothetical protein